MRLLSILFHFRNIKNAGCAQKKLTLGFFWKLAWGLAIGQSWGFNGFIIIRFQDFFNYAVAKYILEANIEAKSGWPLPKPNANYPVLSTVLEEYNYIPWPPYKPPSTEQWTPCEVLISCNKSLNIRNYLLVLNNTMYYESGGSWPPLLIT